jgi:MFS transporter, DHA2 family, multidrug resistance protein
MISPPQNISRVPAKKLGLFNRSRLLQNLMSYPALTTGLVAMPRGIGSMAAMFLVAPLITRVDNRLIILFGLLMTSAAMWQMSQFSLQMSMASVVISGLMQGFGLGCTQVPLNIIALSTLPRHIMTQGTAIRSLMRNLGGSTGISILVATLAQNTQTVHSRLVEGLRPEQSARAGALSGGAVQPDDAERDGSAQRRGDAAGRDGRLCR